MAGNGPAPTAKRILEMRGSWRAKNRPDELALPVQRPPCPAWLKGEARKLFNQLATDLEAGGAIAQVDATGLAGLARIGAEIIRQTKALDAALAAAKPNENRCDTLQGMLRKAVECYFKLAQQFGLTPASRPRVRTSDTVDPQIDAFAAFLDAGEADRRKQTVSGFARKREKPGELQEFIRGATAPPDVPVEPATEANQ